MWATILTFGARFLTSGVVDSLLNYWKSKAASDNERERIYAQKQIAFLTIVAQDKADARRHATVWLSNKVMVWPIAAILWGFVFYWWAVIIDSIFLFQWDVAELPRTILPWANAMVNTIFTGGAVGITAGMILQMMRGK